MNRITKSCTPTLPPTEVNELCRRYAAGEEAALDLLVSSHVAFVTSLANRYGSLGVPVEDLISEGILGLIEAVKRFDPDRGNRFLTYAVFWIRRRILDSLRRDSQPIRRPRKAAAPTKTSAAPRTGHVSRAVTLGDAQQRTRGPEALHFQSLDQGGGENGESSLSDTLEDPRAECPEEGLLRDDTRRVVWSALERLRPNQALVVALRHGLCSERGWTLRQVGDLIGVSRERVRQIEMQAVEQLRLGVRRATARPMGPRQTPAAFARRPFRPKDRRRPGYAGADAPLAGDAANQLQEAASA